MSPSPYLPTRADRVPTPRPAPFTGLWPALVFRQPALLPRVAVATAQLWALPRRVRRALQRQWRGPLVGMALVLALGPGPSLAATIPVSDTCTLVDAITAANTDTVTGGCPAGSGADTIVLPVGSTQTLTAVNNDTYGPTGLPVIRSVVTIVGQGGTIARESGALEFRLLAVNSTGELTLQETTVSGGIAPAPSSYFDPARNGGGVANYGGTFTALNSTIAGNAAMQCREGDYGPFCTGGSGGGMFNSGSLIVTNSTIVGNSALISGGGVVNDSAGTCTVTNSTISGNGTGFCSIAGCLGGSGGGVVNDGTCTVTHSAITTNNAFYGAGVVNSGTLTVTHSLIAENAVASFPGGGDGGGVRSSGTLTVSHSTITGNFAFVGGGMSISGTCTVTHSTIAGNSAAQTGGVSNFGTLTVRNSTIAGNVADASAIGGGGVGNYGTATLINSTIAGNSATQTGGGIFTDGGTLTLTRTLVTGNTASTGPEIVNYGLHSTVTANNHNLFGVNGTAGVEGFSPGATDIVPPAGVQLADILQPTLAFNGGPTQTHALVPGSPAIDAGDTDCTDATGGPLLTDQRGRPRVVDGNGDGTAACDIGAFEFFPLANAFVTLNPALETSRDATPVPGGPAGTFTITATFTNTSDTPLHVPFFTVTDLSGDNLLLNAVEGVMGVGGTVTPDVGDDVFAPGETVAVDFVIGLHTAEPFRFFVDLFGEPLP